MEIFCDSFVMNGYTWSVFIVEYNDQRLVDRTGKLTVATTDPSNSCVCLSSKLEGDFLMTVFIHELGHCALWSYGLLNDIHRMTKYRNWIEMEEFICNILADYGLQIFKIAYKTVGYDAWKTIPKKFENILKNKRGV